MSGASTHPFLRRATGFFSGSPAAHPRLLLLPLLFSVLAALVYGRGLDAFFVSDDFHLVEAVSERGPLGLWFRGGAFFRPLVSLSLSVDYWVWHLRPAGYHLTSLLLHIASSLLVVRVTRRLVDLVCLGWPTGTPTENAGWAQRIGVLAGLVFVLHPSHSEAVAWISARGDLLATFFTLAALSSYLRYKATASTTSLALSMAATLGAFGSKESAIVLPWVLLVCELPEMVGRRSARASSGARWGLRFGLAVLPGAYALVRWLALGSLVGGYGTDVHLELAPRRLAGPVFSYAIRSVFPPLRADAASVACLLVAFAVVGSAVTVAVMKRRALWPAARATWWLLLPMFVITCLPVVNLGISLFDSQGERLLYLPSVFSSIGLALLLGSVFDRRSAAGMQYALLAAMALSLVLSSTQWAKAGRLSQGLMDQARQLPSGVPAMIVNLPDNVSGAYVYRNGFESALRLFGEEVEPHPVVLALHAVHGEHDGVASWLVDRKLTLRLREPRSVKIPIIPGHGSSFVVAEKPELFRVASRTTERLVLELVGDPSTALYFSRGGRLYPVDRR